MRKKLSRVERLRCAVADLYHIEDGRRGLRWLVQCVLANGVYACLSEVPEAHMLAVLAAERAG
jgi:hypothetical protein